MAIEIRECKSCGRLTQGSIGDVAKGEDWIRVQEEERYMDRDSYNRQIKIP